MFRIIPIFFIFLLFPLYVHSQDAASNELLSSGLKELQNGENEYAQRIFIDVLNQGELAAFHPEALYWLVKTDILLESYTEAANAADQYLFEFPGHKYQQEMQYQRGRLLYLDGEPEKAITALSEFVANNSQSLFVASALYWIGESLMSIGHLEEADAVFSELLTKYPSSVKREAARYRQSELSQLYRERELLNLLKWSHEEYLHDAEEFYRREAELLEQRGTSTGTEQQDLLTRRLLVMKNNLLDMQSYYINEIMRLTDAE